MPPTYFVDTWFFVASIDRLDGHHRQARRLRSFIGASPLVTHDAVLAEVLAFFSAHGARLRAEAVAATRSALRDVNVISGSRQLFTAALDLYERRSDKEYSPVDCMSMVVMEARGITHVLTNDHHFRQEGFIVVSDAP